MQGVLRWLRRLALGALLVVAAVTALVLITAHTDWGRDQLRVRVEAALGQAFPGGARVRRIDGSILGTLTVRDIELDGRDHRPLVTIGTLEVEVALWPLVVRTARIDQLIADDVRVVVREQPPAPTQPPTAAAAPSAWRVELPRVAIRRASLAIEAGARMSLADLELSGSATVGPAGVAMFVWSRAWLPERRAALDAIAAVTAGGGLRIAAAVIRLGGATIAATGVAIDGERPSGVIAVGTSAAALFALSPELAELVELGGLGAAATQLDPIVATIELAPASPTPREAAAALPVTARAELHAAAGAMRLWASLRGTPRSVRGVISAHDVALALATHGRLCGRGDALVALDADEDRLRGTLVLHAAPGGGVAGGAGDAGGAGGLACDPSKLAVRDAIVALDGALVRPLAPAWAGRLGLRLDPALGTANALVVAGGDAVQVLAVGAAHRAHGALVLEAMRTRVVAAATRVAVAGMAVSGAFTLAPTPGSTLAPSLRLAGVIDGGALELTSPPGSSPRPSLRLSAVHVPFVVTRREIAGLAARAPGSSQPPDRAALDVVVAGASGAGLRYDDLAIPALDASLIAQLVPLVRLDEVHAAVAGVRRGGALLGAARVDLHRRGPDRYEISIAASPATPGLAVATEGMVEWSALPRVALGRSRVTLPGGAVWSGLGGRIVVGPDVRLRDLRLASGGASVALRGDLARRTGAFAVHVDADQLAAAAVDARLRGRATGTIDVARRAGAWQADGRFDVAGLTLGPDAPAIDGAVHVALAGSRATLELHAASPTLGDVALAFEATAPRDPLDLAAWRALDVAAIRRAEITAERVDLGGPGGLGGLGGPARLRGTVDGRVDLAPGALHGALAVRGVELPVASGAAAPPQLEADLTFAPRDGELGAHAAARLAGVAALDLTGRFAVPRHPFDPATWQHHGRDLLREASADLEGVAVDAPLLATLGLAGPLAARGLALPVRARLGVELALGAAASEARLAIDVTDITGDRLAEPLAAHVQVSAGPSGTHGRAELVSRRLALGALELDVPMTVDRWIEEPASALAAALTGRWELPVTQAAPVLAIVGRRDLASGTLEGGATIGGTLARPVIEAQLIARAVVARPPLGGHASPALDRLAVDAGWDGAAGRITIDAREAGGGVLHASATGRPDALAEVTGAVRAQRLDVAPLAAFWQRQLVPTAGLVDADLALRAGGRITGTLDVAGGVLPIGPAVGTLRNTRAHVVIDERATTAKVDGHLGAGTFHLVADGGPALSTIAIQTLQLRDVSLTGALRPRITADVTAQLRRELAQITGRVTVANATVTLPEHTGTPVLDAAVPDDLVFVGAATPVAAGPRPPAHPWLVLDLEVGATRIDARELAEGVGFDGTLHADRLRLAVGDAVGVTGNVAVDGADVVILGRRYVVDPSDLDFDDTTDPRLGIHMSHTFPEMTLLVEVGGRASKPEPRFGSEPGGYSQDQLFGFFLGGEPGNDPNSDPSSQTREAVAGAGALLVSSKLGRQVNKVLPIKVDALSCEPSTTASSASCTGGKWLSERLFLAYRRHLEPRSDENSGDAEVQIRMGRKVVIQGTGGDRGHYGADLLWRHRW